MSVRGGVAHSPNHAAALVAAGIDATTAAAMASDRPVTPAMGSGVYRSNPSAQELFQAAGAAARGARQRLAGAHVVLAAADLEHGTLARALGRLEVDRAALRAAAASELALPAWPQLRLPASAVPMPSSA